jgi:uncharacterized membrane protein YfhO
MTVTFTKITNDQWFKVFKAFMYAGISLFLADIPAILAHNPKYVALAVPINVVLVILKQIVTQDESQAVAQLPNTEQQNAFLKDPSDKTIMEGVDQLANDITDTAGNPVTDPNAAR